MEKKSNGTLVGILIGIIIMLLVGIALFAIGTISFKASTTNQSKETIETEKEDKKIYSADEYISLEDVSFNSKVTTKKSKIKSFRWKCYERVL